MSTPTLDIVIVNWNSGEQLHNCLQSLVAMKCESFSLKQVVVVDNHSSDGSSDLDIDSILLPLTIVKNNNNRGFGAACNQGAGKGCGTYILFLNPDTVVTRDSIDRAVSWMESRDGASTGVSGVRMTDRSGATWRGCARIPKPSMLISYTLGLDRLFPRLFPSHFMHEWDHESSREVDHVIGAFYLVRRQLFMQLAGFDERFFVYLEDLDFSCRTKESGYSVYYLADTHVFHEGGGTSQQVKGARLFYSLRSKLRYGRKHFTPVSYALLLLLTLTAEFLIRIGLSVVHFSLQEAKAVCEAYRMLWASLLSDGSDRQEK